MRVARVGWILVLAACQPAAVKPEEEKPRSSHWGCALDKAKNPARIDSPVILNEFPEYRAALGVPRHSSEYYFALSRVTAEFDQAVLKVVREEGFDCVIEKSSAPSNQRLPDITYHVLRQILSPDDKLRSPLVQQVIEHEEETWTLLRNAVEKESKLQAALAQIQQLNTQRDQLQLAIQNEQAKVQQIEASLAALTREKIQVEAARTETQKNNETLTAELNKSQAALAQSKQDLANLQAQSQAGTANLQAAQKQVAELQALKNQVDEQLKAAADTKGKLDVQIAALTKQVNELSGSNAALTEQVAHLKNDKSQLEKQMAQTNAAKGQVEGQLSAERTRVGALEKRVQELEIERQSRLAQLQKDSTELSAQLTVIQEAVAKFAGAKPDDQQLSAVKTQVSDLEVKVRVISAELNRVSNLDKQTQDRIKSLTEAVTVLKQQISTFAR